MAKRNLLVDWNTPKVADFKLTSDKTDRNGPCPCGSGQKAKKCKRCNTPSIIPPVHTLSEQDYIQVVERELGKRHGDVTMAVGRSYIIASYWNDGVITPERCCDLLEVLDRHEREDDARRAAGKYPGLAPRNNGN